MNLVVRGGSVVEADGVIEGDLWVQGGRSMGVFPAGRLPPESEGAREVDARGLYILPGAVDVHVHLREPGLTHKEDFSSGTAAAAAGGATTVIDMPNTLPPVASAETLAAKASAAEGRIHVDVGFYGVLAAGRESELPGLLASGALGMKLFLGPTTGDIRPPEGQALLEACKLIARSGLPLAVHAEDRSAVEAAAAGLAAESVWGYDDFLASRPRSGELKATRQAIQLARASGVRMHIAHVTLAEAVEEIRRAKRDGAAITAETCPQYLFLTDSDAGRLGTEMKILPPVRGEKDRKTLWKGLLEGAIDLVSTDHAPHAPEEKEGDFRSAAAGAAGLETWMPLMLDAALRGVISLEQAVRWTSLRPAAIFGLHPRKGWLGPGADADFILFDPSGTTLIEGARFLSKCQRSIYEGRRLRGRIAAVYLRGVQVSEEGRLVTPHEGKALLAPRA